MNKRILDSMLAVVALLITLVGCTKEKALTASDPERTFEFPQGNQSYDQRIMDFYKKHGKYILYKFSDREFRYNINGYIYFTSDIADPAWIDLALDSLDKHFFGYYDAATLNKLLPHKFFLASRIRKAKGFNQVLGDTLPEPVNSVHTLGQVSFGHVHNRFATLTPSDWKTIRGELHGNCWEQATNAGKILIPFAFHNGLDYINTVDDFSYPSYGIIEYNAYANESMGRSAASDFATYVRYITSHTRVELDDTILNPANDPTGIFRKKYNIVIAFCKSNFHVDLQAIGERP